jgi:hypothetical protein
LSAAIGAIQVLVQKSAIWQSTTRSAPSVPQQTTALGELAALNMIAR